MMPFGDVDLVVADGAAWTDYLLKSQPPNAVTFGQQLDALRRFESSTTLVLALESREKGATMPGGVLSALPPSWAWSLGAGLGRCGHPGAHEHPRHDPLGGPVPPGGRGAHPARGAAAPGDAMRARFATTAAATRPRRRGTGPDLHPRHPEDPGGRHLPGRGHLSRRLPPGAAAAPDRGHLRGAPRPRPRRDAPGRSPTSAPGIRRASGGSRASAAPSSRRLLPTRSPRWRSHRTARCT